VHLHVLRRLRRLPLPAGILEFPDQFLLLGVDGDAVGDQSRNSQLRDTFTR
jgi:hypothetical protein